MFTLNLLISVFISFIIRLDSLKTQLPKVSESISTKNKVDNALIPNAAKVLGTTALITLCNAAPSLAFIGETVPHVATGVELYSKYFLAGGVGASFSHAIAVPFDVVKTRKQINKDMSKLSAIGAFKKIVNDDGFGMLFKGLGPTITGYLVQGSMKYGFYELFKIAFVSLLDPDPNNKLVVFMLAASCAELIGSSFLAPFEACRIRQVADPTYSTGLIPCLQKMYATEGIDSLYRGLPAILSKQLPYTIVQLSSFEFIATKLYALLGEQSKLHYTAL